MNLNVKHYINKVKKPRNLAFVHAISALFVFVQEYFVVENLWEFFFVMCHHDDSLVFPLSECSDDFFHQLTIVIIQSV